MSWKETLSEKLATLTEAEFDYIETRDISRAKEIDLNNSGIYMEATVIYFEIKNIAFMLKENGRRKMAQTYTMYREVIASIVERDGAFVNCFSPNSFLIVYPGKDESLKAACIGAMKIADAISHTFKAQFSSISGLEFAMGLDHGHIMGTKNLSDNGMEHITWFGTSIYKAMTICKNCSRPFYVGISGIIFHNLDEDMRVRTRRILGIKKRTEVWNKVSYQYDNVKKHLYQTNQKIDIEAETDNE